MTMYDEHLNIEQLLKSARDLKPESFISLYFDPDTYYFYINYEGVMPFWIPRKAAFIGKCQACYVQLELQKLIAYGVRKLTEEPKSEL